MNEIRALVLCNNVLALPGLREFIFYGKVAAVAVPGRNKELIQVLTPLLTEVGVPLLVLSKKDFEAQLLSAIEQYQPNIGIMMTFPYLLPQPILQAMPKGFINFHYGLLPECRGPQPILRHMLNNDSYGGISVHVVDAGIDTGAIICQEKIAIESMDTYGIMQGKLAYLGAKLAANVLKILSYGTIIPSVIQDENKAVYYEMPTAAELTINWKQMTAGEILRLVNACNPWNKGAGTVIRDWTIGITEVEVTGELENRQATGGEILQCNKQDGLIVATADAKKLKINIVYTNEGFLSGSRLTEFNINTGDIFQ